MTLQPCFGNIQLAFKLIAVRFRPDQVTNTLANPAEELQLRSTRFRKPLHTKNVDQVADTSL